MISISNLIKKYGNNVALDDISLQIPEQSIYAIVGPNGAGKSTLLKILTKVLDYDSGTIKYGDISAVNELRKKISYLPEQKGLYDGIDIETQLIFFANIRELDDKKAKSSLDKWLTRFDIRSWRHRRVSELSKGMQQKVQLISSLISYPSLLFMDEPFSGIDPINFHTFIDIIKEYQKENGATIVLSTHNMKSVEDLCTDVALFNKGKLKVSGNVTYVKKAYTKQTSFIVEIDTSNQVVNSDDIYSKLKDHFNISISQVDQNRFRVELDDIRTNLSTGECMELILHRLSGYEVFQCSKKIPSMEDIFIEIGNK